MAGKTGLILAGIAGALALGTGGYFANEWRVCKVLEADYLEEAAAIGTDLHSGEAMRGLVQQEQLGNRVAASMEKANRIYWRIKSQCGDDTAVAVQQKALDVIEDVRREPS